MRLSETKHMGLTICSKKVMPLDETYYPDENPLTCKVNVMESDRLIFLQVLFFIRTGDGGDKCKETGNHGYYLFVSCLYICDLK